MNAARRYAHRSMLSALAGMVLVTLLTVSASTAAAGGNAAGEQASAATISARTDVFIRDYVGDVGVEPHSYAGALYVSPDIKVCPTAIECAVSGNPVVGSTSYVFVNLRNPGPYGSGTSTGTLQVYRTVPGGGAGWPSAWTLIGSRNVTAYPGTTTVTIPWASVPGPGHFCLVARWVSGSDPMTIEGPDIGYNTRMNNNIAWRNVDTVRMRIGLPEVRPFAIGNLLNVATKNDLVFTPVGEPFQIAGGRLTVDLGPTLFERWLQGGGRGVGVRQVGKTELEIVDPQRAQINDLVLYPGERPVLNLTFSATADSSREFELLVNQFGPSVTGNEKADLGGVLYQLSTGQR